MATRAPGHHYREGIALTDLFRMFPDNATAEDWFCKTRWPNGTACHYCGSLNVQDRCGPQDHADALPRLS